jgi:hypothetical protein
MNCLLERMGKELIRICFDVLSRHLPGGRESENRTGFCYVESCADRVMLARWTGEGVEGVNC